MKLYRNILVPTDGSETAQRAVKHGIGLAEALGARVYGIYVIDISAFATLPTEMVWENLKNLLSDESEKALKFAEEKAEERGIIFEGVVKEGVPAEEIVNTAQEKNVDLIVMGTSGRTGLDKFLLGSVAEKVVRTSYCPVLIVHR